MTNCFYITLGTPEVIETDFGLTDKYGYRRGYEVTIVERLWQEADRGGYEVEPGTYFDVKLQPVRDRMGDGRWWPYQASTYIRGRFKTREEALAYAGKAAGNARNRLVKSLAA